MHARAALLISTLGLRPHPEGGWYAECHRSASVVRPCDERPQRTAVTTIYFLLAAGERSRWHAVASDEVWHFYEGDPLELLTTDAMFAAIGRHVLAPVGERARPMHVVAANVWQAARTTGAYTLVGCTVAPGFDFADFRLLADDSGQARELVRRHASAAAFL